MQENRRGMKRSTVVVLIISLVLMLGGAAMAVTGIALGGLQQLDGVTINGHPIRINGSQEPLASTSVSVEAFKNMDIAADGSRLRFVDDDEYYVEGTYAPNCEPLIDVQDGTLYVRDWAAMEGGSVGLVDNQDGTKGIFVTDGSGNDVRLDGDGIQITDEDGTQVTINGIGIHVQGEDGTDIQVGSPDDPFTIDLSGIDGSVDYEYPEIVIHCPMSEQYGTVVLQSGWLDDAIEGLKAESLQLGTDSSSLAFRNAQIGSLTGNAEYADLSFDTCKLGTVELSGSSLSFVMKDTEAAGNVTLNAGDTLGEFGVTGCTFGGDLNVQTESVDGSIEYSTVAGAVNIGSTYGSMNIQNSTMDSLAVKGDTLSLTMNGTTVTKDAAVSMQTGDEIKVSNSTLGTFSLNDADNGGNLDFDMTNTTASGAVKVAAAYGELDFENVTANGLTASLEDGDIEFDGALTGAAEITTTYGDIDLVIHGDKKEYSYALNSQSGDMTVDDAPYRATVTQEKSPNTIQADTEDGDISLTFVR